MNVYTRTNKQKADVKMLHEVGGKWKQTKKPERKQAKLVLL